jgi:hypothetical protein
MTMEIKSFLSRHGFVGEWTNLFYFKWRALVAITKKVPRPLNQKNKSFYKISSKQLYCRLLSNVIQSGPTRKVIIENQYGPMGLGKIF